MKFRVKFNYGYYKLPTPRNPASIAETTNSVVFTFFQAVPYIIDGILILADVKINLVLFIGLLYNKIMLFF